MSTPSHKHQDRKDKDMYEMYTKLSGQDKFKHSYIMEKLTERFYLEPATIMTRIRAFARNKDKDPNQLTLQLPI